MTLKLNPIHLAAVVVGSVVEGLVLRSSFGTDWFEFAGFVTGVVGVYLAAVEHIINWPISIANVLIYAWVFFSGRLFADMTLQFFYFALSIHGWWQWAYGGSKKMVLSTPEASNSHGPETAGETKALPITRVTPKAWILIAGLWILGTAIYTPIITYFKGALPLADSTLTVGSIIAQIMLNTKKLENWMMWILIDACYIPLYISKHYIATAILYGLFLALAVFGLLNWKKTMRPVPSA